MFIQKPINCLIHMTISILQYNSIRILFRIFKLLYKLLFNVSVIILRINNIPIPISILITNNLI